MTNSACYSFRLRKSRQGVDVVKGQRICNDFHQREDHLNVAVVVLASRAPSSAPGASFSTEGTVVPPSPVPPLLFPPRGAPEASQRRRTWPRRAALWEQRLICATRRGSRAGSSPRVLRGPRYQLTRRGAKGTPRRGGVRHAPAPPSPPPSSPRFPSTPPLPSV